MQLRNSGAEQQASRASTTLKWLFSTAKCSAVLPPSLICHVTCQTPPRLRLCVSSFTHTHTHTQHTHTHTHTHTMCVCAHALSAAGTMRGRNRSEAGAHRRTGTQAHRYDGGRRGQDLHGDEPRAARMCQEHLHDSVMPCWRPPPPPPHTPARRTHQLRQHRPTTSTA